MIRRRYFGSRRNGVGVVLREVLPTRGRVVLPLYRDVAQHAEEFEWGHRGTGARQLAAALVADVFGPARVPELSDLLLPFVEQLPDAEFAISDRDVRRAIGQAIPDDMPIAYETVRLMPSGDRFREVLRVTSPSQFRGAEIVRGTSPAGEC